MYDKTGDLFEDMELTSNLKRYEAMKAGGVFSYFDIDEFVTIINYYLDNDQMKKAMDACKTGLKVHPAAPELKLKYAQLLVARGQSAEAMILLKQIKTILTGNHEFYLTLAMAKILTGEEKEAIGCFDQTISLCNGAEKEEVFFNIGESLENSGFYEIALGYYKQAIAAFPDNEEFLFRTAFCYDRANNLAESIHFYNLYLDKNPFSENGWYNLGIIHNKAGEFEKAIEAYDFAIALDDDHFDAVFNKANTLANWEKYDEAIAIYNEYLESYPDSLIALYYLGECYLQLEQPDKAESFFDRIIVSFPDFADAWYGKGLVYETNEKYQDAIIALRKAVQIDKEHNDAWFSLGKILAITGKNSEAFEAYQNAVSLNRYDVEAWINYALVADLMGKPKDALEIIEKAMEYSPDEVDLMYALAAYLYKNNQIELGLTWFEKASLLVPNQKSIYFTIVPENENLPEIQSILNKNTRVN
jgi:tetratricopeptide (TPR) repeat protein